MGEDERVVKRVLLLAAGAQAQAVMEAVKVLSRTWLGVTPPLYPLVIEAGLGGVDEPGIEPTRLAEACDALADQRLLEELQAAGWQLAHANEIQVWLMLDLTDEAGLFAGDKARAQIVAVLRAFTEVAWQRLRVQVAAHAFVLAEPAAQRALDDWSQDLARVGIEQLYVASPVSYDHLRLTPFVWQARAANGLAALLWCAYPSHTLLARSFAEGAVCALGAAVWLAPRVMLKQWLALRTAKAVVERLQKSLCAAQGASVGGGNRADLPLSMDQPRQSLPSGRALLDWVGSLLGAEQALAALVTPPPNGEVWRGRRPAWGQLATLVASLTAMAAKREERNLVVQRQARQQWLAATMTAWAQAREQSLQEQIAPAQGWPLLAEQQRIWEGLLQVTQAHAVEVAEQLAAAGARLERAEREEEQAKQRLEALVQALPAYTVRGMLTAVMQPWRWVDWLWTYYERLPQCGQRYLDCLAARQWTAWAEANWHVVRQVYLGVGQDVRQQLNWLMVLAQQLVGVANVLAGQLEQTEQALPTPWQRARLEQLWERRLGRFGERQALDGTTVREDADEGLGHFLRQTPLAAWGELTLEALTSRLIVWATELWDEVEQWSVDDCLALAFGDAGQAANRAQGPMHGETQPFTPDLCAWLEHLLQQAAPLWPNEETAHELQERWLLLPPVKPIGKSGAEWPAPLEAQDERGMEMIQAWAEMQPDLLRSVSPVDGIVAVRWVEVGNS